MMKSHEKMQKYRFSAILAVNFLIENRIPLSLGHDHFATLCKRSEDSNKPIRKKLPANKQSAFHKFSMNIKHDNS